MVLGRRRRRFMPQRQPLPPNPLFTRPRAKRRGWSRQTIITVALCVGVMLLGLLYWLLQSNHFSISEPTITVNNPAIQAETTALVESYLKRTTLGIFRQNNYWALSTVSLRTYLNDQLADTVKLQTIEVHKQYPNSLIIEATIYEPHVRFTSGTSTTVYVIDEEGIVTGKYEAPPAPAEGETVTETTVLPLLHDQNDRIVQIGKQMTSAALISAVDTIARTQQNYSLTFELYAIPEIHCPIPPATLETLGDENTNTGTLMPNENTNVLNTNTLRIQNTNTTPECDRTALINESEQVNAVLADGPTVYFSFAYDLTEELDRLRLFMDAKKAEIKNMHYIDVRFPEHIYYQ